MKRLKSKKKRECDTPGCTVWYLPMNFTQTTCPSCMAKAEYEQLLFECKVRRAEREEMRRRASRRSRVRAYKKWNRKNAARKMREINLRRRAEAEAIKQVPR